MCGIAGILGPMAAADIKVALERMNSAMVHRGPDAKGLWCEDGFGFAMRRLSIIDLDSGNQPMWDEARGLGLVYNGETYNYKELRHSLQEKGESFRTSSDTEVVLKTLAAHGEKALDLFNGMYGAALWNTRKSELLLFRDRLGIKPLYYYFDGRCLIFASEIKAILASELIETKLNRQAIWDYLTLRYIPEPDTAWQGLRTLPPGHLLRWGRGRTTPEICAYWKREAVAQNEVCDFATAQREFEELFLDSVEKHLVAADVPVGVLLSGGLDSSAIAAAAVELGHRNFHTFSVGFKDGGEFTELPYAKQLAAHVGSRHHELVIGQDDFMSLLPEMVHAAEEPLADLASIPLLAISRLAREHVKVVLSGEGGDEVLGGYNFENRVRTWDMIRRVQSIPRPLHGILTSLARFLPQARRDALQRVFSIPLKDWNSHFPAHMTKHWDEEEKKRLWPQFQGEDTMRVIHSLYRQAPYNEPLDQMLYAYQRDWMVEDLLMKADKMSMAASLELRVPFLDYRLVEWAARQHQSVKVGPFKGQRYTTKNILRRFAARRIPSDIINRPKQGFPVPAYTWFNKSGFRDRIESHVLSSTIISKLFTLNAVRDVINEAEKNDLRAAHKAWLLMVLAVWGEQYSQHLDM
jgi:asparagine synthase (glutamine-hydrolysing)